jgi:hypothetical protein
MRVNSGTRTVTVASIIFLILVCRCDAAWVGKDGQMWLEWNIATRNAYVYAYVAGITRGFMQGCNTGVDYLSSTKSYPASETKKIIEGCSALSPVKLNEIDDRLLGQWITKFYTKYPGQRFLYISDVILKLLAGRTIDQIHREFPQSDGSAKE